MIIGRALQIDRSFGAKRRPLSDFHSAEVLVQSRSDELAVFFVEIFYRMKKMGALVCGELRDEFLHLDFALFERTPHI